MRLPDQLDIDAAGERALEAIVEAVIGDSRAPSTVRDRDAAWRVHIADSLSALCFQQLVAARRIADVGSGAGFPGLPLAAAQRSSRVELIESTGRKCEFIERVIAGAGLTNARVICERSEVVAQADGRNTYDAVTARAVGRLSTIAELASPLLRDDGVLVAWKGRRDVAEEAELDRAGPDLAMASVEVRSVGPYAGSRHRHLHLLRKIGPTPDGLPRRAGQAKKRPLGRA